MLEHTWGKLEEGVASRNPQLVWPMIMLAVDSGTCIPKQTPNPSMCDGNGPRGEGGLLHAAFTLVMPKRVTWPRFAGDSSHRTKACAAVIVIIMITLTFASQN